MLMLTVCRSLLICNLSGIHGNQCWIDTYRPPGPGVLNERTSRAAGELGAVEGLCSDVTPAPVKDPSSGGTATLTDSSGWGDEQLWF